MTRDTVILETPARRATSAMVLMIPLIAEPAGQPARGERGAGAYRVRDVLTVTHSQVSIVPIRCQEPPGEWGNGSGTHAGRPIARKREQGIYLIMLIIT